MAYLEIKDFKKSFGNLQVLKGIDLTLEKGEVLSIIGSSGSGKTTFLRCINFLETADFGSMVLEGEELFDYENSNSYTESELRDKRLNFGLVFQSFNLFPQYSVLQNITLAPLLIAKDQLKKQKLKRKELKLSFENQKSIIEKDGLEILNRVGLIDKKDSYPCELSGGQCQRVAIARALALKPKILCFDEPTSALDPELTGEVLKVIRSLKDEDRTMIIVTHEMGFAKNVSDKVVFMADGIVEEVGNPDQIFNRPKSEKLAHFLSSISDKDGENI